MLPCQISVAIDGPAGAGKSSVARAVASDLGLVYLDTGAMYRAITWKAGQLQIPLTDAEGLGKLATATRFYWCEQANALPKLYMDGKPLPDAIRSPEVTAAVSSVASYEQVRSIMRQQQKLLGLGKGIVMDGRDIGTVVMPHADCKIYLTATLAARADRRREERGLASDMLPQLMQEMAARDQKDTSRQHSPLSVAADAIVLDTTGLSLQEVVDCVKQYIKQVCSNKGE